MTRHAPLRATCSEGAGTEQVSISLDLLDTVYRTLNYYASVTTYQAPRIGGVLAGCPRGEKPTPDQLVRDAREVVEMLDAWNAARTAPPVAAHALPATPVVDQKAADVSDKPLPPAAVEAFARIMGDPTMPPDDSPAYDRWLFTKAWDAAVAAALGMEVIDDRADADGANAPDGGQR